MHLMPKDCVTNRFKMLEYYRVCSTSESVCALPLDMICYF